jgi:CubicO group peptidase (beta-lactamase class C family)
MIVMPPYAFRALWFQMPGIDDYKIFHNRVVEAGAGEPWAIAHDYNRAQLPDDIADDMASYDPVAFLIIQDKKIIYEDYWDGYNANTISNSFSAAKSIVGLLVGAAIDDGYIKNLDQKVADFIPSFKEGEKSKISIRDLLTMSSGLDWDEAYASLFSPTTESYYGTDLKGMINRSKSVSPPGKYHYYSSLDTETLALVILNATGKSISNYASDKFWKHMGAEQDALWCLDHENGLEKAFCCFNSNARDFARWGQLVLNDGSWNGKQLISETYLKQSISPADYLTDETGKKVDYYGFQWWIIDYKGYQIPYMRGILGQYVFAIKEKNAVVVRLGHKRSDELIGPNRKDIFVYLDAAFNILGQ